MNEPLCRELDDLIEDFASGGLSPTDGQRAHLTSCAACARALALAAEIDRMLARQPAPDPGSDFSSRLLTRIRRERWRSEQMLDLAFNIVVALAVLTGIGGLYAVFAATGLAIMAADATRIVAVAAADVAVRAAPQARVYVLATITLATGLIVWWWAERGFSEF